MNMHAGPAAASQPVSPAPKRSRPIRADQEFLAPALEILETPASPVRMALVLIICAFVAIALGWAYLGRVDIIATAAGKIEPTGKVKVVQPLQTGKIAEILVENGDHVTAGQIVAQIDAVDAKSQLNDVTQQVAALAAEIVRRRTAIALIASLRGGEHFAITPIAWSADVPEPLRLREDGVLHRDLLQLQAELSSIEAQIAQKQTHARSIAATIVAQQSLNVTLRDLANMGETLVNKEAGSKADWFRALETLKAQEVTLTSEQTQQADDEATATVLRQEADKVRSAFLADYMQKLAIAGQRADDLSHKVQQAQSLLDQFTLRSPIDGIIQASSLTTLGQVVTTGQELMRVVPVAKAIDVEAYLPNEDIGFVHVGQTATVKVAAFPFTQYGTVSAKIIRIGKDALSASDAQQAMTDPSRSNGTAGASGAADAVQGLVFSISVELDSKSINVDGTEVDLMAGMGVTVEVNTGSRRILEYLFSPMVEVTSAAMHER